MFNVGLSSLGSVTIDVVGEGRGVGERERERATSERLTIGNAVDSYMFFCVERVL